MILKQPKRTFLLLDMHRCDMPYVPKSHGAL